MPKIICLDAVSECKKEFDSPKEARDKLLNKDNIPCGWTKKDYIDYFNRELDKAIETSNRIEEKMYERCQERLLAKLQKVADKFLEREENDDDLSSDIIKDFLKYYGEEVAAPLRAKAAEYPQPHGNNERSVAETL